MLFDVGGTLIHPHPSVGHIYAQVAEGHGVKESPNEINLKFKESWKKNKKIRTAIDKNWWKKIVFDVFDKNQFQSPESFFEELYKEFEQKHSWRIYPDVEDTLTALKNRAIRLALASNWDSRLPKLLDDLGLSRHFEKQFISFQIDLIKPDPKFFQTALHDLHLDPLEVIHIGDDLEEDIEGAQQAGLRAYLIDRLHKPKNSRGLSSLNEILVRI
ncbi:MAG: Phosphoglycolate phosphatase [Elusimicrobia bacterium]|nr:Phosphoglycolate phosphatase [Elusimicrobiota bacterium]